VRTKDNNNNNKSTTYILAVRFVRPLFILISRV